MGDSVVSIAAPLRRYTETVSSRPLRRILKSCHLVKVLGTDHRKEVEVGGVPVHIEGRHESMSLNEGGESRLWVSSIPPNQNGTRAKVDFLSFAAQPWSIGEKHTGRPTCSKIAPKPRKEASVMRVGCIFEE